MTLTRALADRCRARGLGVNEMPGWLTRGETDGPFSVRGVILHHDGMGLGNTNVPNYMSQDGVNGAQLWIAKDGCVWFLAAGRKWHAGVGCGWRSIPANQGNSCCVGIETDHTDGQAWTAPQLVSMVVLTQEICAEYGLDPNQSCCGHKEYAPGRKNDPESYDLDAWRAAVKSSKCGVTVETITKPTTAEVDDDMALLVFRDKASGADYAHNPQVFITVQNEAMYNLLLANKWITVPHGNAEGVARNLIEWTRGQVLARGGHADELI